MFSKRLKPFIIYPFAELEKAKQACIKRGIEIIDFGVGDPERLYLPEIAEYIIEEMRKQDAFRYPSYEGEKELRESFCRYFEARYGVTLNPDKECLVLIGSKEGIAHLPLAIMNPGEIALVPDPGYPVYNFGAALAGGKVKKIKLTEKNGWLVDPTKLDRNAKLIFVNYPTNPTGAVAPIELYNDLVKAAKKMGAIVVNDAAYAEIYFDKPTHSILEAKGAKDVAVEFHSASKTFGIPGARVGFLVGAERVISALAALKKNVDSGQFKPLQLALAKAYSKPELIDSVRELFKKRSEIFYNEVKNIFPCLKLPKATFYVWVKIPDSAGTKSSADFAKFLIERAGIVVLPGVAMGKCGDGYIRFSLTISDDAIVKGCRRLAKVCSKTC